MNNKRNEEDNKSSLEELSAVKTNANILVNNKLLKDASNAVKEMDIAYRGVNYSENRVFQKSLRKIHRYERNTLNDTKAQAGYTAEVLDTAKRNANKQFTDSKIKFTRVDDIPGRPVNETAYDITALDVNGNEITDMASQMKFVGKDAKMQTKMLISSKWRKKYPHATYSVPSERYEDIKGLLLEEENTLISQIDSLEKKGQVTKAVQCKERLDYVRKVNSNLVKSNVSSSEAIFATKHPVLETMKLDLKYGHVVGKKYAKVSGSISFLYSICQNANSLLAGEITAEEAVKNMTKDTVKGIGKGYIAGQANSITKGIMKNSKRAFIRELAETNMPTYTFALATDVISSLYDCGAGKITVEKCFDNISSSAAGFSGEVVGEKIGKEVGIEVSKRLGKETVVSACSMMGTMIFAVVAKHIYAVGTKKIKSYRLSQQERIYIEKQCAVIHETLLEMRTRFKETYVAYTQELKYIFSESLQNMALAMKIDDIDLYVKSANIIIQSLGKEVQYENVDEFIEILESDTPFNL